MDALPAGARSEVVACDVCGTLVDPVRAPDVAVFDERYRFYCSRECGRRGRSRTARSTEGPVPATAPRPRRPDVVEAADMLGLSRASLPTEATEPAVPDLAHDREDLQRAPATEALPDATRAAIGLAMAVLAVALAATDGSAWLRAWVLGALAFTTVGIATSVVWKAWHAGDAAPAAGLVGALVPLLVFPRTMAASIGALREVTLVAAVIPVVGWVIAARRGEAGRRLGALGASLVSRASVVRGELSEVVHAARVRVGEEVEVTAGMTVPVDGVVRSGEGHALLYPLAVTPRRRVQGDAVLAGARVTEGKLRVLATRAGDEVAWARLGRLLDPGAVRPHMVTLALRATVVAPAVLAAVAIAVALGRGLMGEGDSAAAAAWLLALAPCAGLVALVELPFVDALGAAARRGIVFRDAAGVEAAAHVGTVVLCMRGTVTTGRLELTEVVSLGARSEEELLARVAAAEEIAAGDPIARAITDAAVRRKVPAEGVRRLVRVAGQGITAVSAGGEALVAGNRRLLLSEGIPVAPAEDVARSIEGAGRTVVLVAVDGRVEGVFGLEDPVRDEARSAVQAMIDAGVDVALLGGASRGTLEAIGMMLDVNNLRPEVLPEERAGVVRSLSETGRGVAVVGRAAWDSGALAAADVAISIEAAGGEGTDTAVALASDDLRDAAAALSLARRGRDRALALITVGAGAAGVALVTLALAPWLGPFVVAGGVAVTVLVEALPPKDG